MSWGKEGIFIHMKILSFLILLNIFSFQGKAFECSKFLEVEKKLIKLDLTLIRPQPQFKDSKDISIQIVALIKIDPISDFFTEINVTEINYDVLMDKIFFKVEFKKFVNEVSVVFTKSGQFDFSDKNQIVGFSLDPLFKIIPPALMTDKENRSYDLWLIEFFKKINATDLQIEYVFSNV